MVQGYFQSKELEDREDVGGQMWELGQCASFFRWNWAGPSAKREEIASGAYALSRIFRNLKSEISVRFERWMNIPEWMTPIWM
jgi:hypothetical protein